MHRLGSAFARQARASPFRGVARAPIRSFHQSFPRLQKTQKTGFHRLFHWIGVASVAAVAVPTVFIVGFFAFDSSTYDTSGPLQSDILVPIDCSDLPRGGPKNLPIADRFIDDIEIGHYRNGKPHLVILGSGWGGTTLLKNINTDHYNVTVISPTNHFLFTPLLPSAAVGTLSVQSLTEPIRVMCRKKRARFLEGAARDIVMDQKLIEVRTEDHKGNPVEYYVPYDKVVIGAGAKSRTFGVPGLENCYFFKTAVDARELRKALCRNFEAASQPTCTAEERKRLLSFVVCGGGPTGVELASEIYDLLKEDLTKNYPCALLNSVSVHIIQSREHILNTYDAEIAKYAMKRFMQEGINLHVNSRVQKVTPDAVIFTTKEGVSKTPTTYELPYGICLWTTGIDLSRLTKRIIDVLGAPFQVNKHGLETDTQLRVIGAPKGEVYAIGDCATVRFDTCAEVTELIHKLVNKHHVDSNRVTRSQLQRTLVDVASRIPQAAIHIEKFSKTLDKQYTPEQFVDMEATRKSLKEIDTHVTSLPATAQRASQQGKYLAKKFNRLAKASPDVQRSPDADFMVYQPFQYQHMGSLAYIPGEALFDTKGGDWLNGIIAMYLWRSVYFSQTLSSRTRFHMATDWANRGIFGRDIYLQDRVSKN